MIPTRYFLAPPPVGEEMHVVIDQGKTLILKLIASGPVSASTGMRDVLFEMNGEMRAVQVEDKSAVTETFTAEKSTGEPGSIGCEFIFCSPLPNIASMKLTPPLGE